MLQIKNNKLSLSNEVINSANYILNLYVEQEDVNYFGLLTFGDGIEKILAFTKTQQSFKYTTRLIITEEDLNHLANVKFSIVIISNSLKKTTNTISLPIDFNNVKQTIKVSASKEIKNLKLEFNELKNKINNILEGKVLQSINIVNKEYIKKGMIPVAEDNGDWVASYPFLNMVTSINEQEAVNGEVILDASMIQYTQEKTISTSLREITEAVTQLNNSILTISNQLKTINNRLNEVELEIEVNKNSGII